MSGQNQVICKYNQTVTDAERSNRTKPNQTKDSVNTQISAETNMITKYVKTIILMEVVQPKDILNNAEDSKAIWDVGSMKYVPTNTQRKTTLQTNVKLTEL